MISRAGAGAALVMVLFAALAYGVFATVLLSLERALRLDWRVGAAAGAVAAALVVVAAARHGPHGALRGPVLVAARRVGERSWIVACIAVGSLLRVAWALAVPPTPTSDHATYLSLAASLAERGQFGLGHPSLFRPPGISMALAPLVAALGDRPLVPLLLNLLLFTAMVPATYLLGRRLAGGDTARLAVALVALWPNLIMLAGFANKELLVSALVPAFMLLYLRATDRPAWQGGAGWAAGAGLALGAMVLTQPHSALLAPVLVTFEWLRGGKWGAALARLAVAAVAALLVVLPWTVRNYLVSGELVPVSANGGHVLWVGNNPQATGGYVDVRPAWAETHEITYDRAALRWALAWMRANPGAFLRLVPRKQILYLGDDADGAYNSVKQGRGIRDFRYVLAKGSSNGYWVALLSLAAVAVWSGRRRLAGPTAALLGLPLLLQLAVFSITESGGRHHVQLVALLAIVAAMVVARPGDRELPPLAGGTG